MIIEAILLTACVFVAMVGAGFTLRGYDRWRSSRDFARASERFERDRLALVGALKTAGMHVQDLRDHRGANW